RPLPHQLANRTRAAPSAPCGFPHWTEPAGVCGISHPFGQLFPTNRYVTHALLSRLPLEPKLPCDLHVLGTPPAFTLSQDQTLHHLRKVSSLSLYETKTIFVSKGIKCLKSC